MNANEVLGTFPDRHTIRLELFYKHAPARVWEEVPARSRPRPDAGTAIQPAGRAPVA
jgi:hypothetical protein